MSFEIYQNNFFIIEFSISLKSELKGKHDEIKDNQKGVSFKNLFGEYFTGAKEVRIIRYLAGPGIKKNHEIKDDHHFLYITCDSLRFRVTITSAMAGHTNAGRV